jgi:hypothetical protein
MAFITRRNVKTALKNAYPICLRLTMLATCFKFYLEKGVHTRLEVFIAMKN